MNPFGNRTPDDTGALRRDCSEILSRSCRRSCRNNATSECAREWREDGGGARILLQRPTRCHLSLIELQAGLECGLRCAPIQSVGCKHGRGGKENENGGLESFTGPLLPRFIVSFLGESFLFSIFLPLRLLSFLSLPTTPWIVSTFYPGLTGCYLIELGSFFIGFATSSGGFSSLWDRCAACLLWEGAGRPAKGQGRAKGKEKRSIDVAFGQH